jgi:hypothetical protein
MSYERQKIEQVVYAAIDDLNEQFANEQKLAKALDTVLLGKGSRLDSVGFINLLVLLEEKCQEQCQINISLTDGFEMAGDANPFRTVESLIVFVGEITEGARLRGR